MCIDRHITDNCLKFKQSQQFATYLLRKKRNKNNSKIFDRNLKKKEDLCMFDVYKQIVF